MNDFRIRADSFVLRKRRIRIYRVRHRGSATVFWISADQALRYLKKIQEQRLQARQGR
ncbi:MAG: hypothetical protein AB7H77_00520 [Bdellovibrionales bacterium]